jgi:hypothetical protein
MTEFMNKVRVLLNDKAGIIGLFDTPTSKIIDSNNVQKCMCPTELFIINLLKNANKCGYSIITVFELFNPSMV